MKHDRRNEVHRINYLGTELESLYHQSSLKLGLSDSVSIVLYSIYDAGYDCLLSDIYKNSGISKQTINSAIRSLEADGLLRLEQHTGRSKRIVPTDRGRAYIRQTVARLYQAEAEAFHTWTDDEVSTYIRLMEKYIGCLRQQIEAL